MTKIKTGIVKDSRFLEHTMGPFHVESPERLKAIYALLELGSSHLTTVEPRIATEQEIERIHHREYVRRLKSTSGKDRVVLDPDTSTSARSYHTALLAAGGAMAAADRILAGDIRNGFALIRPPGHHAEASRAMGFCLFNNIAITAEHLRKEHGLDRVFIFDWDLHHGNGTQHSFYDRSDVLYSSTHQFPLYPGTGHWRENGEGEGEGYTVNIPLMPGKGDGDFLAVLDAMIKPIILSYRPDFILVSAGFDIYADDPLGGMKVSTAGFGAMTRVLMEAAAEVCGDRLLFILEGGYHIQGQAAAVVEVLNQLSGRKEKPDIHPHLSSSLARELAGGYAVHSKFWDLPLLDDS